MTVGAVPGPDPTAGRFAPFVDRATRALGATAAIIGGAYLVAWLVGAAARWSATGVITMKANMSLALVLAGAALLLVEPGRASAPHRIVAIAAAVVVFLTGVLTLGEHLFRYDLGIDQLLAAELPGAAATSSPNRVGIPGSASLALVGSGLIAALSNRRLAAITATQPPSSRSGTC